MQLHIFNTNLETWIIYRGYDDGLSKIVKDAYQNYEDMEFETKEPNKRTVRNVKCISVKKKKVSLLRLIYMHNIYAYIRICPNKRIGSLTVCNL